MSLRKKLMGSEVEIHVPPADPMSQIIKDADAFSGQLNSLFAERNHYKGLSERFACQLEVAQRQLATVAEEREGWRQLACRMINANGRQKATLDNIEAMFRNIRNTNLEVDHLAAQLPEPISSDNQAFDENGVPVQSTANGDGSAPTPTPNELRDLAARLAAESGK